MAAGGGKRTLFDFSATDIDGAERSLAEWKGQVCLYIDERDAVVESESLTRLPSTVMHLAISLFYFESKQSGVRRSESTALVYRYVS
jgi:hypothetical protein